MKYVKITGQKHADTLSKLRKLYGTDAIIFSEKEVKSSSFFSKLMGKKYFLIEAAIQEKKQPDKQTKINMPQLSQKDIVTDTKSQVNNKTFLKDLNKHLEKSNQTSITDENQMHVLKNDVRFIKEFVSQLAYNQHTPPKVPEEFQNLNDYLISQDMDQQIAQTIIHKIQTSLPQNKWHNTETLYQYTLKHLVSSINCVKEFNSQRIIAFIGPTGIGKTTSLAKLASHLKLQQKKTLTLISLDNYRIAATEQLKIYARILDAEFSVCSNNKQLTDTIKASKSDYILLDTAGISHKDNKLLKKNQLLLTEENNSSIPYIEKHLALSASSKFSDMLDIVESFSIFHFDYILLTKLDETNQLGHLINLFKEVKQPLSFLTNGQNVPDDFMEANPNYIAELILNQYKK